MKKHIDLLRCDELWQLFLYLNERTIAKPPDVEKLLTHSIHRSLNDTEYVASFQRTQSAGDLNSCFYAEAKTYLVDDILTKVDRASMAVSLETRIPFLDHRIAEYAMGLSASVKMGKYGGARKVILRRLLARYLPIELFERPKRGFSVPLARWLRGELRWLVDEHLDSGRLKQEGLCNVPFVEQLVAEHMSGSRDREAVLWALIFWQMWRKERNVN